MELEEFYKTNRPFYIDPNTGSAYFSSAKYLTMSHAEWFTDIHMQWIGIVRGRVFITDDHNDDHILLYVNNFNIPGTNMDVLPYLFEHFPTVKWVGLGCYIGKLGEEWKPQLKVERVKPCE